MKVIGIERMEMQSSLEKQHHRQGNKRWLCLCCHVRHIVKLIGLS